MKTKWLKKQIKRFTDELERPSKWDNHSVLLFFLLMAVLVGINYIVERFM